MTTLSPPHAFQLKQSLPQRDWTELVAQRIRGYVSLAGQHLLRQVLSELGSGLNVRPA